MKKHLFSYILLFIFVLAGSSIMVSGVITKIQEGKRAKNIDSYVTGYYARYCYKSGSENKNIKNKLYFDSLYECGKPLNQ